MSNYSFDLNWKKYCFGPREEWIAQDGDVRYIIEQVTPGKDDQWYLSWADESAVNEKGNLDVHQLGIHKSWSAAKHTAWKHREGRREDLAQRTVVEFRHPDFDSILSVFTNGYTRLTEVILNEDDENGQRVTRSIELDRDQVQALYEALGQVVEVQNKARQAS